MVEKSTKGTSTKQTKKAEVKKVKQGEKKPEAKAEKKVSASVSKIKELKIELLKSPTKRKRVKREIARLLTEMNAQNKSGGKN
jgi:ribosomal protein L29